ncbi:MAG: hypothetical protein U1E76_18900 [Planctomycetota bacterium]
MLLLDLLSCLALAAGDQVDPSELKIIYAGNPGSPREADFVSFLEEHFGEVQALPITEVTEAKVKDGDVVIFDWTSSYKENKEYAGEYPQVQLGASFAKASVLIGGMGATIGGGRGTKLDWL